MKINANMSAVLTNNQLRRTENKLTAAMERLSSGLKLNSAEDSPAGMAISNKMKAQIDGLDRAENNAGDGVSVLQIADGALNEVHSMLQRMRELSVQAANGTNSLSDRQSIQREMEQLSQEINRISADTEYNTKPLLDGSSDIRTYADHVTRVQVSDYVEPGDYSLVIEKAPKKAQMEFPMKDEQGNPIEPTGNTPMGLKANFTINDQGVKITEDMTGSQIYEAVRNAVEQAGASVTQAGASVTQDGTKAVVTTDKAGATAHLTITTSEDNQALVSAITGVADFTVDPITKIATSSTRYGEDVTITIDTDSRFTTTASVKANGNRIEITDQNGVSIKFLLDEGYEKKLDATGAILEDGKINFQVTDIGAMTIQLGANEHQIIDIRIPSVSSEALYLDTIDVTVSGGSEEAMTILDEAVAAVSSARSRIGASQNRLEYAQGSLAETQENMTSAYSTLKDTDMAEEMTEYTQQSILNQAAISVLSQANEIPQQVLSLLG